MIRWKSLTLGAVAFLASHALESANWSAFDPGAAYSPWFLNSGRAVVFTAACLLAAAAIEGIVAASTWRDAIVRGGNIAAGAFVAMCIVLLARGPGTLFPIALALGGLVAAASSIAGALIGSGVRTASRP
jgi:hypothetical protein